MGTQKAFLWLENQVLLPHLMDVEFNSISGSLVSETWFSSHILLYGVPKIVIEDN